MQKRRHSVSVASATADTRPGVLLVVSLAFPGSALHQVSILNAAAVGATTQPTTGAVVVNGKRRRQP